MVLSWTHNNSHQLNSFEFHHSSPNSLDVHHTREPSVCTRQIHTQIALNDTSAPWCYVPPFLLSRCIRWEQFLHIKYVVVRYRVDTKANRAISKTVYEHTIAVMLYFVTNTAIYKQWRTKKHELGGGDARIWKNKLILKIMTTVIVLNDIPPPPSPRIVQPG